MLLLLLLAVGLAVVLGAPRGALSRQAEVLVDDELAADRVGGSAEGEANDDGWYGLLGHGKRTQWGQVMALPRGYSSGGICLSFRSR